LLADDLSRNFLSHDKSTQNPISECVIARKNPRKSNNRVFHLQNEVFIMACYGERVAYKSKLSCKTAILGNQLCESWNFDWKRVFCFFPI